MKTRLAPCGEAAFRVLVEDAAPEHQWEAVHRIAEWIGARPVPGVYGVVPTYDSLLVEFDPSRQTFPMLSALFDVILRDALSDRPGRNKAHRRPRHFTLPVVYGGEQGPDLGWVADYLNVSEADVVALHTAQEYVVRCLGGPAASCMIDGPAFSRPIPRLPDPRLQVPPNAISVAGSQGVVGPVAAPSGWRLIGLSPVDVMDRESATLVPYRPGDFIRFRAIAPSKWDDFVGIRLGELVDEC
ncbi:5-oxoprolinase subunit B family protein [Sinomonas terrae]|uniref:Allophanate hydrolase subunit 1 n=1 Tax=Sinomonas terrae TaxID=2908838 RepID=A0ABS9U0G2_9MICC|nr:carboxyltransferase domain-containing protein [Sinomonas terrae]MCH6470169.1 allophanate hydrolase subunit 1 [Sinomonas terrae]